MASNEIKAGAAYVEIFVKGNVGKELDKVAKQLKGFGDSITSIGKKMAGLGTAIVAPLGLAAQQFASMGDEINKASQRTGVSVENLNKLKYAAEQSGASFEDLEGGLRKMQKAINAASTGNAQVSESFARIGVSVASLKNLDPSEQLIQIGQAFAGIQDPAKRTAMVMEIFGKGGTALLPLFADGAEGIRRLTQRAEELGLVFSKEDAQAATVFGDELADVWKQLRAITFQIGAAVAQALLPFANAVHNVLKTVIDWAKENRGLIIGVLTFGVALVSAGSALIAFGVGVKVLGVVISGITATFSALTATIGFLANPIVLIGGLLVGLAAYFLYASGKGGEALAWLGNRFFALRDIATEAFGGIADALAAGDIGLAATILWTALQLAWLEGTQELQAVWARFKAGFVKVAADAFYGALELWTIVKASLMGAWTETVTFFGNLWDGFIGTFTDLWENAVNLVTKGLNDIKGLWDDTFDSDNANQALDDSLAKKQFERRKGEMGNNSDREAAKQKELARIQADRDKSLSGLVDRNKALDDAANKNANDDIDGLKKKKSDLQGQLDDLRAKAKKERDDAKGLSPLAPPDKLPEPVALGNTSRGLFNIAGLQALQGQGQSTLEKIQKATEDTAKNTKNGNTSSYS